MLMAIDLPVGVLMQHATQREVRSSWKMLLNNNKAVVQNVSAPTTHTFPRLILLRCLFVTHIRPTYFPAVLYYFFSSRSKGTTNLPTKTYSPQKHLLLLMIPSRESKEKLNLISTQEYSCYLLAGLLFILASRILPITRRFAVLDKASPQFYYHLFYNKPHYNGIFFLRLDVLRFLFF